MALAWYLYQHHLFWTEEEEKLIEKHMTPTYLSTDTLQGKRYIEKPIFGREGSNITIIEPNGEVSYQIDDEEDCDKIYQELIKSEEGTQTSDTGTVTGHYTYSCFVINNEASETFLRLEPDGEITEADAYFVPILEKIL